MNIKGNAITFATTGSPEVLRWRPVELGTPGAHDVVIDVMAAGVNNADLLQRQGYYPVPQDASAILGLECAGRIRWVGDAVTSWTVGDDVCALLSGGGYAEHAIVPASQLLPVPKGLDYAQAAALPEAACTVYSNLAMIAGVQASSSVLIHGGAGGMGSFAIQWAKAIGAFVITTAGNQDKIDRVLQFGADVAINYREQRFADLTLRATEGRGVDAILDIVGAPYLDQNLRSLAPDGHLVIIGGTINPAPRLDLSRLISRRLSVTATMLRNRPAEQKAAIVKAVRNDVWPLIDASKIKPVVDTIVPMADAARAHALLHAGDTVGKVVLVRGA